MYGKTPCFYALEQNPQPHTDFLYYFEEVLCLQNVYIETHYVKKVGHVLHFVVMGFRQCVCLPLPVLSQQLLNKQKVAW